jgi:phosphate transport system permease protein
MALDHTRRVKIYDRLATWVITAGGIAIIASVILILFLILSEAAPLFLHARMHLAGGFKDSRTEAAPVLGVGLDDYLEAVVLIDRKGRVVFRQAGDGTVLEQYSLAAAGEDHGEVVAVDAYGALRYSVQWADGAVTLFEVETKTAFDDEGRRTIYHEIGEPATIRPPEGAALPVLAIARRNDEGSVTRVDLDAAGRLHVVQEVVSENLFGERSSESFSQTLEDALPGKVASLVLSTTGTELYAGTENGFLLRWSFEEPGEAELTDLVRAFEDGRTVTALAMVFGDVSLAVGDAKGGLSTWSPVRLYPDSDVRRLHRIHGLTSHSSAIELIVPAQRNKSLLCISKDGQITLDHMTTEQRLLDLESGPPLRLAALAPRANGMVGIDRDGQVSVWTVKNPHPEVSWGTLFGKVWYENYDEPAYVWQSSAATDEFEPKLSLTPLVFGSLKGTLYAMLYAVPLALFGALYTSQFASGRARALIKPAVEVMAAIPSVVVGFLAALWLAPIVENYVMAFLIGPAVIPLVFLGFIFVWQLLRRIDWLKRFELGYEFLVLIPVVAAGGFFAYVLAGSVEQWLFNGSFQSWLFGTFGERYDQRNCIIIAFGLGFAVIPIIFTMADDALSNVPQSLRAASLALGASRWQTVWRVVLPAASPGIFAGVMIGFGRAVGETMIVLMATGNTPIMDWSVFNGMRTLSANIAVEIPEAPQGGTLYRVLFLSAVLLFLLTAILNTGAELVRQRLRKRYGQFQ